MTISLTEGSFDALIFDCDGTLVDTAPAHLRALQVALEPLDLTMTAEWYYPRGGLTPDDLFDEYEVMMGRPGLPRKEIMKRYGVAFQSLVPQIEAAMNNLVSAAGSDAATQSNFQIIRAALEDFGASFNVFSFLFHSFSVLLPQKL